MENYSTADLEQRLCNLSNYVNNLSLNRTKNIERLTEQKINCLAEVTAFRNDLNNLFDRIEDEFRKEIDALESIQKKAIQSVMDELRSLDISITGLKSKLQLFQKHNSSNITFTYQELKNYISKCESEVEHVGKENGVQEIDLYILVKPELQTLSCRLKSLGEAYVTYSPVDIELDVKTPLLQEEENEEINGEQSLPFTEDHDKNREQQNDEEQTMHIVCKTENIEPELEIKQEPKDPEFDFVHQAEDMVSNVNIQKEAAEKVLPTPVVMRPLRPKPTGTSSNADSVPSTSASMANPSIPLKLTTINNVPTLIAAGQSENRLSGPFIRFQQFPKPDKIPLKLASSSQSANPIPIPVVFCQPPVVGSQQSISPRPIILKNIPMSMNSNVAISSKRPAERPMQSLLPAKRTATITETSLNTSSTDQSSSEQQSMETVGEYNNPPAVKEEQLSFDELMEETQKTLADDKYKGSNLYKHAKVKHARRFNQVSAEDLQDMLDQNTEADSTKKNTKWGVKMFQQWSVETSESEVDFDTISKKDLNEKLKYFYAETRPQSAESKVNHSKSVAYQRNTLKNVRSALNRHLKNIKRNFDIVWDPEFKESNALLDTKIKLLKQEASSNPTQYRGIIDLADLQVLCNYVYQPNVDPVSLRHTIWFLMHIYFPSLTLDEIPFLTLESFDFKKDPSGKEYVVLANRISVENDVSEEERMYASDKDFCPVAALRLMIKKTAVSASAIFNKPYDHVKCDIFTPIWYSAKAVARKHLGSYMSEICTNAKCVRMYTPSSLRVTAFKAKSDKDIKKILYNN